MKGYLILVDLDGTLLDGPNRLSPQYITRLNDLIHQGLQISLATGRDLENTRKALPRLNLKLPVILTNGAVLANISSGKILKSFPLPSHIPDEIIAKAQKFQLNPMVYAFIKKPSSKITYLKGKWGNPPISPLNFELVKENIKFPCVSIQFHAQKHRLYPFYSELKKQYQGKIRIIFMKDVGYYKRGHIEEWYWLEINALQAGKANMMKILANRLNIPLKQIIAIGDNHNDIEMLKLAGCGVVVADASEKVKAIANQIIPKSDDGGVIAYLEANKGKILNYE